jgi:D-alanyl-D-alanine carboxypeptidase/D-alanyl-D-alanine-endopeptidase (penicillin-binding protein 4)
LHDIQVKSPAAGHVHAKTGTFLWGNPLGEGSVLVSKALAGYMTTREQKELVFAIYVNHVPLSSKENPRKVGEEIDYACRRPC